MPSPRFTPCATPTSASEMLRLFSVAAAMPMRLHQRHRIADQRRHGARKARGFGLQQRIAQQGKLSRARSHHSRPATVPM